MASTAKITPTKFQLTSDPKNQNDKLIFLEHPKADIFLRSDNWAAIHSRMEFDKSLQEVKLFGDVHIYYDWGFELKTDPLN